MINEGVGCREQVTGKKITKRYITIFQKILGVSNFINSLHETEIW